MNTCRLCPNSATVELYDHPVFESENFFVLSSLGALVEGWLLLVPKTHFICVGALPEALVFEFHHLKGVAASFVQDVYGSVCAFEHGPHIQHRTVGCGVDHAHLHILPGRFDLLSAVTPFLPENTAWRPAGLYECRTAFSESKDYLYFEQEVGRGYLAVSDSFGSQLFRRGIACQLGVPDEYDWRAFPYLDNTKSTIRHAEIWTPRLPIAVGGLEAAA